MFSLTAFLSLNLNIVYLNIVGVKGFNWWTGFLKKNLPKMIMANSINLGGLNPWYIMFFVTALLSQTRGNESNSIRDRYSVFNGCLFFNLNRGFGISQRENFWRLTRATWIQSTAFRQRSRWQTVSTSLAGPRIIVCIFGIYSPGI